MLKLVPGLTAAMLAACATMLPATAGAQRYDGDRYEQAYGNAYRDGYNQPPRGYRGDDRRGYDRRGYERRRCNSGTTGTIVGAIAGGLLGNSIAGRGDRSLGTILGAGGGALAGRAVGRSGNPGYCR